MAERFILAKLTHKSTEKAEREIGINGEKASRERERTREEMKLKQTKPNPTLTLTLNSSIHPLYHPFVEAYLKKIIFCLLSFV